MKTFGRSEHNHEDPLPPPDAGNAPDITIDTLTSFLPEDHRQTFFNILSRNGLTEEFDYTRLLDPLSIQTDTLDTQMSHEVLKRVQDAIIRYYDMDVRDYDSETHTVSVQVQGDTHSEYIADVLECDAYRTVSINPDYDPAIAYMGNKSWLTSLIADGRVTIPQHKIWIEPFCGSATMTLAQCAQPVEIINDYNPYLINFYDVLSRPRLRAVLIDQIAYYLKTPEKARELHLLYLDKMTVRAKKSKGQGERRVTKTISVDRADSITLARAFYMCAKFDFGIHSLGYLDPFQYDADASKKITQRTLEKYVMALESVGKRLERVIIQSGDGLNLIKKYAHETDVFFYIDPPYVLSTRTRGNAGYANELTDEMHRELVDLLLNIKGSAILSGYSSQAYIELEREGWKTLSVELKTMGGIREEVLWIKTDPPSS